MYNGDCLLLRFGLRVICVSVCMTGRLFRAALLVVTPSRFWFFPKVCVKARSTRLPACRSSSHFPFSLRPTSTRSRVWENTASNQVRVKDTGEGGAPGSPLWPRPGTSFALVVSLL